MNLRPPFNYFSTFMIFIHIKFIQEPQRSNFRKIKTFLKYQMHCPTRFLSCWALHNNKNGYISMIAIDRLVWAPSPRNSSSHLQLYFIASTLPCKFGQLFQLISKDKYLHHWQADYHDPWPSSRSMRKVCDGEENIESNDKNIGH